MQRLYRYAGQPYVYVSEWSGTTFSTNTHPSDLGSTKIWRGPRRRRRRRGVGEANFYESSAPANKRYRPLVKAYGQHVAAVAREEGLSGPPLRESGPEPIDPGEMPSWQIAYLEDPTAQPVGLGSAIQLPPGTPGSSFPGCSPGFVPCAAGTRWDSVLCRCVPMTTTKSASPGEITMDPMYVGPVAPAPQASFMGLSTNEKRLAVVAGVGLVGYLLWKKSRK